MHSPYFGLGPYQPPFHFIHFEMGCHIALLSRWNNQSKKLGGYPLPPSEMYHRQVPHHTDIQSETTIKKPSWNQETVKKKKLTNLHVNFRGFGWIFGSPMFQTNTKGCKSIFSDVSPVPTRLHPRKQTCPLKKNQAISEGNSSSSNRHFFRGHLFVFGGQSSVSPAAPPAVPSMARLVLWTPERDVPQLLRKWSLKPPGKVVQFDPLFVVKTAFDLIPIFCGLSFWLIQSIFLVNHL